MSYKSTTGSKVHSFYLRDDVVSAVASVARSRRASTSKMVELMLQDGLKGVGWSKEKALDLEVQAIQNELSDLRKRLSKIGAAKDDGSQGDG